MRPDLLLMGSTFEELVFNQLTEIPGPNKEIITNHFARAPGGRVFSTAVAVARLGLDPCVMSALSLLTREALLREGIAYRNLLRASEAPALTVSLSTEKERRSVAYPGINDVLEDRLLTEVVSGKVQARHVYGAFLPRDCQKWLEPLSALRKATVGLSWDFGWHPDFHHDGAFLDLVSALDVVFFDEAGALLYSAKETLEEALAFWRERAANTVIKRGTDGCHWTGPDGEGSCPGEASDVGESTEAGDTFNGGFLYARISGLDVQESATLATRVAALSAGPPGGMDSIPYREELE
jgi:sugar/nucleoside kinase (ribokinase family)